jgi:DNA-binding NarL/FixJ family response regulator
MIKIVIVEDQKIILSSLGALLDKDNNIQIVGEAANGEELLALVEKNPKIDLILSDIAMPKMDGISMIIELKKRDIQIPVLLLSILEDEKYSSEAFLAGAMGYLSKNIEIDELLFAIHSALKGNRYFSSELCIRLLERYHKQLVNFPNDSNKRIAFSERELSILKLIAAGQTNQQMADKLFLSRRTVEGIRQGILERTGVKNTASLINFAILNGYIGS